MNRRCSRKITSGRTLNYINRIHFFVAELMEAGTSAYNEHYPSPTDDRGGSFPITSSQPSYCVTYRYSTIIPISLFINNVHESRRKFTLFIVSKVTSDSLWYNLFLVSKSPQRFRTKKWIIRTKCLIVVHLACLASSTSTATNHR